MKWAVSILAAGVLYVLSVPPVVIGSWAISPGRGYHWAVIYAQPYEWVYGNTPLKKPLKAYSSFCARVSQWASEL
jgi:hypothetical protein